MIEAKSAYQRLIYLASPYSSTSPDLVNLRVEAVQDATARLIEAGHLVFSPIVHSHPIKDLVSFNPLNGGGALTGWMEFDKAFIDKADEVWILRLEGHTRSKGVHAELYHALDQGKIVRYINYPDLSEHTKVEPCSVNPNGLPDLWDRELTREDFGKLNTFGKAFPVGPMESINLDQADGFGGEDSNHRFDGEHDCFLADCKNLPQKPTIIGLTGHAQSGKDTAGKYLVDIQGFTRIGLADAVKECLYALDPMYKGPERVNPENYWTRIPQLVDGCGWDYAKEKYPEVRQLLQRMGTEVGRKIISETIWLDIAERKIKELGPNAKIVITDIRFPNEAEWIRSLGGQVVRINRPNTGPVNDHASDQKLSDNLVDVEVENNYDLNFLYLQLETKVLPYAHATA